MPSVANSLEHLEVQALKAAFAPRDIATEAWNEIRRHHTFRTMPDPVARLCGQIYQNIGLTNDHPDHDRLRGAYKSNHIHGILQLSGVATGLDALAQQGISYLIVKGAAVALHTNKFGIRRLGDIDVAVTSNEVERAQQVLESVGFMPKAPTRWSTASRTQWRSCGALVNGTGAELDLMISGTKPSDLISIFLADQTSTARIEWMGHNLKVASPEQLIILSLVHGFQGMGKSDFIQSIADTVTLLEISDFDRLREISSQCRLGFMLDATMNLLLELELVDSRGLPAETKSPMRHAQLRTKVLRRQGRSRKSLISSAYVILRELPMRWRGLRPPMNERRYASWRTYIYRVWLVAFRLARAERFLLRFFGTLTQPDRVFRLNCGESIWINDGPSAWDFRFRLDLSDSDVRAVRLASDFVCLNLLVMSVYESGRSQGEMPHSNGPPLIIYPSRGQRYLEISIRNAFEIVPNDAFRCRVTLDCGVE